MATVLNALCFVTSSGLQHHISILHRSYTYIYIYVYIHIYTYVYIHSVSFHIYIYICRIVFLDISMPLLESMLLSLLLTPVEIGPSNASPG